MLQWGGGMMSKKDWIIGISGITVALAVIIAVLYFLWQGLIVVSTGVINLFQTISTLDTVIVIALFSGAISVIGIVINSLISIRIKASEHKYKRQAEMRARMEQPYSKFVNMIFDMLLEFSKSEHGQFDEDELKALMYDFSKAAVLHGSNRVVKKWNKYRTSATKIPPAESMKLLEEVLFSIRADLGIKRKFMKTGDLLSLIVNDMDEFLKKK